MKVIQHRSLIVSFAVLFFLLDGSRHSQRARGATKPATPVGTGSGSAATNSSPYAVLSRGPNSRVFGTVTLATNALGRVMTRTNVAYTELASGLHFRRNGQWIPTREQITPLPAGSSFAAAAT